MNESDLKREEQVARCIATLQFQGNVSLQAECFLTAEEIDEEREALFKSKEAK